MDFVMIFIGSAIMSVFMGGLGLVFVLRAQLDRSQGMTSRQTWRTIVLVLLLFGLELSVLSNVVVCIFLALVIYGGISRPVDGTLDTAYESVASALPFVLFAVQGFFVLLMSLAFAWRHRPEERKVTATNGTRND